MTNSAAKQDQHFPDPSFIDYSVVYRQKEIKQLNKRLKKTRNILLISALAFVAGGMAFYLIPNAEFSNLTLGIYIAMALLLALLALISANKPYGILLAGLVFCIIYWGIEVITGMAENLLIEGTIHKLCIISLLVSGLHSSKEAELIKKELHFS